MIDNAVLASGAAAGSRHRLLSVEDTLSLLGNMPRTCYHKLRNSGRFGPAAIKLGKRVYHRVAEVEAWIANGCPPAHQWNYSPNTAPAATERR